MSVKTEIISLQSSLSLPELKSLIQSVIGRAEVSPLENSILDNPSDFGILVEKKALMSGVSAVQVHINRDGDMNAVDLVALGDSGFSRAMGGYRNTTSMSGSIKLAEEIATSIRMNDEQMQ